MSSKGWIIYGDDGTPAKPHTVYRTKREAVKQLNDAHGLDAWIEEVGHGE